MPCGSSYYTVSEGRTARSTRGLHTLDRNRSGVMQLPHHADPLAETYMTNSLMEEAIASRILEGAATTRKVAKDMLRKGKKPENSSEQMVLNAYQAMNCIRDKKDGVLSPGLICDSHRMVTNRTIDEGSVGCFRKDNDTVVADPLPGVIYHVPPDFTTIREFIDELCAFANDQAGWVGKDQEPFLHPVIRGIVLHYLVGYLHPFSDGNGRTARSFLLVRPVEGVRDLCMPANITDYIAFEEEVLPRIPSDRI